MGAICNYRYCVFCSLRTLQRFHSGVKQTVGEVTDPYYECLDCRGSNYLSEEELEVFEEFLQMSLRGAKYPPPGRTGPAPEETRRE